LYKNKTNNSKKFVYFKLIQIIEVMEEHIKKYKSIREDGQGYDEPLLSDKNENLLNQKNQNQNNNYQLLNQADKDVFNQNEFLLAQRHETIPVSNYNYSSSSSNSIFKNNKSLIAISIITTIIYIIILFTLYSYR
jgi:hypothetical protein